MSLEDKAIKIKGKDYVLVADRLKFFVDNYPNGSIRTELISSPDAERVIVKAIVVPDCSKPERWFADYSQALIGDGYINKTSALENCSTSAIGRCLALLGIGLLESIASADEINKAEAQAKIIDKMPVKKVITEKDKIKQEISNMIKSNSIESQLVPQLIGELFGKERFDQLTEEEATSLLSHIKKYN